MNAVAEEGVGDGLGEDGFETEADNVYRNEFLNSKTGRALFAEEAE
jgi:hypothetical protein